MGPVIRAERLVKRFGSLTAVAGIDFAIYPGECFGFLGPNGAGKTSTLRMITCVSPVTDGDLWVNGKSVQREARRIKAELGVVPQSDNLDSNLSVLQNLLVHARFFNIPDKVARIRAAEVLDLFQLQDKAESKVDELSGGMQRRLVLARALIQEPRTLILDEPTTGLDPQARHLVWQRIRLLKSQGITILLSSHYMEEASALCDRLVIMDSGKLVAEGAPAELVRRHVGAEVVEIPVGPAKEDHERVMSALRQRGLEPEDDGERVVVYGENGAVLPDETEYPDLVRRPANLEDVFLHLTGRGLYEE
jgi:lipooligosaccharide transport system ATP-binding protein